MTKQEILTKCKDLLYGSPLSRPLGENDYNFLIRLFQLHPRFSEKCNGCNIKAIIVRANPTYKNRNFALILSDNSVVDISYIESVNRKGLKEDIRSACSEIIEDIKKDSVDINSVVKSWLKNFDNEDLTIGLYLDNKHFKNQDLINNFRNFYSQS